MEESESNYYGDDSLAFEGFMADGAPKVHAVVTEDVEPAWRRRVIIEDLFP